MTSTRSHFFLNNSYGFIIDNEPLNLSQIALEENDTLNYMKDQGGLAYTLRLQQKHKKAISILNKVERYFEKKNYNRELFYVYMNKSSQFIGLNELDSMLINLKKSSRNCKVFS